MKPRPDLSSSSSPPVRSNKKSGGSRGSRRPFVITGGIVGPESVKPNASHPKVARSAEARAAAARLALGNLILRLVDSDVANDENRILNGIKEDDSEPGDR